MAKRNSSFQINLPFIFKTRSLALTAIVLSQLCARSSYGCPDDRIELRDGSCVTADQYTTLKQSSEYAGSGNANGDSSSKDIIKDTLQAGLATLRNRGKTTASSTSKDDKDKKSSSAQCTASEILNKTCQGTYDWIDGAKLTNTLTQAAGSTLIGTTNQMGAMKAQSAGTQTAVMEAAANSQEKAGMLQATTGLANAAMGAYQIMLSRQHKQIGEKDLKYDLDEAQSNAAATGQSSSANTNAVTIQKAMNEQKQVERAAMMSGVQSMITGVTQTLSGTLAIGAAKQAKEMAAKLSDATGSSYQLTSTNPDTGTLNPTTTTAINPGASSDPAVASDDGNLKAGDVPTITPPINPDNVAGGPGAGPVAGSFQAGDAKGPGGGGSPNLGVGSMSPAKAEPEQTGARMAESKSNTAYSQGGGSGYAAGAGVSAEKSADLGFLANLLPKPQEEMGKNGILDYGSAGRSPASMTPYSFLGKDVNIFQRISDRTTAKLKNGDIGS